MRKVEIEFSSDESAANFMAWLSDGGGEQDYFMLIDESGQPGESGFDYDFDNFTVKGRG